MNTEADGHTGQPQTPGWLQTPILPVRQTQEIKALPRTPACTKAGDVCEATQTHKRAYAKSHTCADADRPGCVGVIILWAPDLSLSPSPPHARQSQLRSSAHIRLRWTGLDWGRRGMKVSSCEVTAQVQSFSPESSRQEARLEESRLPSPARRPCLGGVAKTAGAPSPANRVTEGLAATCVHCEQVLCGS